MKTNSLEKGFSLVELMVALGILALGMAAVGLMLLSSFEASRHNRNVRNAESVLRYVAEEFSAGNPGVGSPATPLPAIGSAVVRGNNFITDTSDTNPGTYYCSWNSTAYKTSGLNQLDLTVGWGKSLNTTKPCNRDNPGQCPFVIRLTNFY
jgi:prepilin-type N-terminal cleavage/methylation domain-containing protein